MKRYGKTVVIVSILLFLGGGARAQNSIDNSEFSIARIKWGSGNGWSFNPQWAHDWPSSEFNVMTKLKQVTSIDLTVNAHIVELDDPRLFEYTFAYMCEVQGCILSDEEAKGLREYLLRGGFLMVDDSWSSWGLEHFTDELKKVFPDRVLEPIGTDHPIFHSFYTIDNIPSIQGRRWGRGIGPPQCYGITDDHGRLMVLLNWDNDIGDGWEWAKIDRSSGLNAYKLGINYVLYSLSH